MSIPAASPDPIVAEDQWPATDIGAAVQQASVPGSVVEEDLLLVPIRMVKSLRYCPREAWYRFTLNEDPLNVHMERGLRRHDIFDQATPEPTNGRVIRHLLVFAPALGVQGVLDEVNFTPTETVIVEYKASTVVRHLWDGIVAQLIVQALALREHAASDRWLGSPLIEPIRLRVYFTMSRRYREIDWTVEAERQAREAVARSRAVLAAATPPPGNVGPRCANCQHEPICLPFDLPSWLEAGSREKTPR